MFTADGCLGYRFDEDDLSSGGWSQYSCSELLNPICAVRPAADCTASSCAYNISAEVAHGQLLFRLGECVEVRCWHGYKVPIEIDGCESKS